MKNVPLIACDHKKIVKVENDTICSKCGVITDKVEFLQNHVGKNSKANLYEILTIGSKEDLPNTNETNLLRHYFHGSTNDDKTKKCMQLLSKFSNTCNKLNMSDVAQIYAWNLFKKTAPKKSSRKIGETAYWAIYQSCKIHGIPITDKEIEQAIVTNFHRKGLQNLISIMYNYMDCAPDGAVKGDKNYYFRLNLKKMIKDRLQNRPHYTELEKMAWKMYNDIYTEGNYNTRARRAIAMAWGLKN